MPAFCHEYTCGCIIHQLAGTIRKCPGLDSRTLSGRPVSKPDSAEKRHNEAMAKSPLHIYEVAEILP